MRAVAQRCRHTGPPMRTLITMGSQHQGVYNLPEVTKQSVIRSSVLMRRQDLALFKHGELHTPALASRDTS